jgi:hypothetical protein
LITHGQEAASLSYRADEIPIINTGLGVIGETLKEKTGITAFCSKPLFKYSTGVPNFTMATKTLKIKW